MNILHTLTTPTGVVVSVLVLALIVFVLLPATLKARARSAAAREFEGAKPALIHAADTTVDKLPDTLDITALETAAHTALVALLHRLLAGNPLLSNGSALLIGMLPSVFMELPKTVDVTAYKVKLKDGLHLLITEAKF